MLENEISYKIRGAIFIVFNHFGPELLEPAFESALTHELQKQGLIVARQVHLPLVYAGVEIEGGYRMDMIVDKKV